MRTLILATALCLFALPSTAKAPLEPGVSRAADTRFHVSLTRTACFGTCPVYSVAVASDGRVTWEGERHVAAEGRRTAQVSRAEVGRLRATILRSGFYRLPREIGQVGTDLPSQTITVTIDGRSHNVTNHRANPPPAFTQVAEAIDRTARTSAWIGPRPSMR